eukprot:5804442-Prymnesium_polylepis.1
MTGRLAGTGEAGRALRERAGHEWGTSLRRSTRRRSPQRRPEGPLGVVMGRSERRRGRHA